MTKLIKYFCVMLPFLYHTNPQNQQISTSASLTIYGNLMVNLKAKRHT